MGLTRTMSIRSVTCAENTIDVLKKPIIMYVTEKNVTYMDIYKNIHTVSTNLIELKYLLKIC